MMEIDGNVMEKIISIFFHLLFPDLMTLNFEIMMKVKLNILT